MVVNADEIAAGLPARIEGAGLREMALIGAVDQISDNVGVLAHALWAWRIVTGELGAE